MKRNTLLTIATILAGAASMGFELTGYRNAAIVMLIIAYTVAILLITRIYEESDNE